MLKRFLSLAMLVAVLVAVPSPASAQPPPQQAAPQGSRPTRQTRGLFGGGVGDTSQSLMLNLSFGGVYDEDLTPGGRPPRQDGTGSANVDYSFGYEFGRLSVGASAGSSAHYYPAVSNDVILGHRAALSASFKITEKTMLSVNQRFSYRPHRVTSFYPLGLAGEPGLGPVSDPAFDPAFGITTDNYLDFGTTVNLAKQVSRRGSLNLDYSRNQSNLTTASGRQVFQSLRGGFSYSVAKGLALRAAYGRDFRGGTVAGQSRWRTQVIDAGVDFNRALSISRRATLAFGTGATAIDNSGRRRYFATGAADFNYEIGRSWTATLSYRRQVQFIDTIADPLIGDSVTIGVGGLLSRRLQLNSFVGSRMGRFGIATTGPEFRSSHAGINLSVAIARYLAINANYSYFTYRAGSGAVLPVNIRPRMDRQSLRVTLNAWVPLIVRTRSANASR